MNGGKGIYVGGTLISILISLALYFSGRRETAIFVGLWAPTRFRILALAKLLAALLFGDEILLELFHRAAGFVHEPAKVSGHGGELAGTEDDQEEEPYDHHLLHADAEHGA